MPPLPCNLLADVLKQLDQGYVNVFIRDYVADLIENAQRCHAADIAAVEALNAELRAACSSALYLLGKDADRAAIGEKPWGSAGAESVPETLRAALAKSRTA
jgi:hypothetical protein